MPSSTPLLLGPPQLHQESPSISIATTPTAAASTTVPRRRYADVLMENLDKHAIEEGLSRFAIRKKPLMGLTENRSPTFLSTGNPCLDFFFHVVPDTPQETLINRLQLAWDHDPLTTLKLVCNLRGVRGTGRSDKEGFYTAALWLHKNHPKTLACNVASFAEFGYFKDLLEILFRVLEGADARKLVKEKWEMRKSEVEKWESKRKLWEIRRKMRRGVRGFRLLIKLKRRRSESDLIQWRKSLKVLGGSNLSREQKRIQKAKRVIDMFNHDPDFKFLHNCVSDVFAQCLRSDMKLSKSGDSNKISLASKWCPSLGSSFDRITLLCETIGKKVFPREEYPEYEGMEEAHYAYRVRDRLRKEVLVPLRRTLQLPEVYIGANDWGSIPYNRVASVAMKLYTRKFFKHDEERFREYLDRVKSGEATIAAGALLPHEIIAALKIRVDYSIYDVCIYDDEDVDDSVAELQWKRMVSDMAKKGKLSNCLAICDVSGSMSGIPMDVSVALGILVSELNEEPWKGKIITFSENPKLQMVEGESLRAKTGFVRKMEWGGNTNFQKVFDLILAVAVNGKLKPDEMIKRLFVFSDMEFDYASQRPWETDYEAIVRKFRENGYGENVPEIVFWNLRDSKATPVPASQAGVALVSGFSKNLMTVFLEKGGSLDPETVMEIAISGEEYLKLAVVD